MHTANWFRLHLSGIYINILQKDGLFTILNNIDVSLRAGEVLGVLGESGSGKTLLVRAIAELLHRQRRGFNEKGTQEHEEYFLEKRYILQGSLCIEANKAKPTPNANPRQAEARPEAKPEIPRAAIIYQQVQEALNPTLRVGQILSEVLQSTTGLQELLETVQLPTQKEFLKRYVHELSGGMLQRLAIACVLAAHTDIIIADEALSALDETTSRGIVQVFRKIAEEQGRTVIFVSHNLRLIETCCDRVLVVYAGQILEHANTHDFITKPRHPYSGALIRSDPRYSFQGIPGTVVPAGTRFRACPYVERCTQGIDLCEEQLPALQANTGGSGAFRCHNPLTKPT